MNKKIGHNETHKTHRVGWLRAAVLGANDGIVSTASLLVGVAAGGATRDALILSGTAGLMAGAMSMAAGEYVSVSSQADIEAADLALEKRELAADPAHELAELAGIYRQRGLDAKLALEVARQLTSQDALKAHAREELGINDFTKAHPIQAALASALAFSVGAVLPLLVGILAPYESLTIAVPATSLFFLVTLGMLAARAGGAGVLKGAVRVGFWGAFAMAATAWIGSLFGTVIA